MINVQPRDLITYKDGDYTAKADVSRITDTSIVALVKPSKSYKMPILVTFSTSTGKPISEELPGVLLQQFWKGKTISKTRPQNA